MKRVIAVVCVFLAALPMMIDYLIVPSPSRTPERVRASPKQWGGEAPSEAVSDFKLNVDDEQIQDLKSRLSKWRSWNSSTPMKHESAKWTYGMDAAYMHGLVPYWRDSYDWQVHQEKMNKIGLQSTVIDGLKMVFYHANKGSDKAILLLHGWPGSIHEFTRFLEMLPSSELSNFSVVCPSLPGYGFSSAPISEGYDALEMANTMHRLMSRLAYKGYIVQGGDWGSIVAQSMVYIDPSPISGLHLNFFPLVPSPGHFALNMLRVWLFDNENSKRRAWAMLDAESLLRHTGYFHQQATKPETLGFSLADSPVGLAAWIIEKFQSWSDPDQLLESKFDRDDLLTNVMIYWLTNTATSSMRLYYEFMASRDGLAILHRPLSSVPVGLSLFPHDLPFAPPDIMIKQKFTDLRYFNLRQEGGHFAALEKPNELLSDLASFIEAAGL